MPSIVKVRWKKEELWRAELLLAGESGFGTKSLEPGSKINFEVTNKRRCTGYSSDIGERKPCPEYRKIDSGSKCFSCRQNDIYTNYVRGTGGLDTDKNFSVYLVQSGNAVKVGVTRSEKLERRWVEQGADFGCEIFSDLTSEKALKKEKTVSENKNIKQRIRKEKKLEKPSENKLEEIINNEGYETSVINLRDKTVYGKVSGHNLSRKGRISGKIKSVKGQIVSTKRVSMAMTQGKVVRKPVQQGLDGF